MPMSATISRNDPSLNRLIARVRSGDQQCAYELLRRLRPSLAVLVSNSGEPSLQRATESACRELWQMLDSAEPDSKGTVQDALWRITEGAVRTMVADRRRPGSRHEVAWTSLPDAALVRAARGLTRPRTRRTRQNFSPA